MGSKPRYYDRDGRPINAETLGRLFVDPGYKIVQRTAVGPIVISTVWLGVDHRYGDGPPLIFETLPQDTRTGAWLEDDMMRYPTEAAAVAGHDQVVAAALERLGHDVEVRDVRSR